MISCGSHHALTPRLSDAMLGVRLMPACQPLPEQGNLLNIQDDLHAQALALNIQFHRWHL
jgi:hypothetical protein